jgi:prepilin-type N-terminal cleavage/methylation domain-containing protein/prepilin-type processing-associated H-X9-DG protein
MNVSSTSRNRGFTLIELLVVIAIIAILAAILFPVFARARENARRASCQSNLKQIALGVFQYTQDYDEKYPKVIVNGGSGSPPSGTTSTPTNPYGWADALQPYLKSTQIFQCPSETGAPTAAISGNFSGQTDPTATQYTDYWYNSQLSTASQASIESVSLTVMNGDGTGDRSYYYYDGCNANGGTTVSTCDTTVGYIQGLGSAHGRHLDGGNYAFADGHVKWLKGNTLGAGTTIDSSNAVRNKAWASSYGYPTFGIN